MKTKIILALIATVILLLTLIRLSNTQGGRSTISSTTGGINSNPPLKLVHPLQISEMRKKIYPGSEITIEQELGIKNNYKQYLASYMSEGLKINALLTVPQGNKPQGGWPVIIFNHGYIPPEQYRTTERYVAYIDAFARNNFIVFKPDYRGHGSSEGNPEGAYFSPAYTIDVLNALASIKKFNDANPGKIGMWGHSMGGSITIRSMVVAKDIKAGVIWGGVVGSYEDLLSRWRRRTPWRPTQRENMARRPSRNDLIMEFGDINSNPDFWKSISPTSYLSDISGPIELHHGLNDETVPWEFSESLKNSMEQVGKEVEYYTYPGGDHNLSDPNFGLAMRRSIEFFNKHLKTA